MVQCLIKHKNNFTLLYFTYDVLTIQKLYVHDGFNIY
jgi:hypothetical protein